MVDCYLRDQNDMELYKEYLDGSHGSYSLKIDLETSREVDFECDAIRDATYEAAALIKSAVMTEIIRNDPECIEKAKIQKEMLLATFPTSIQFTYKEIPNGYCSDWCCKHLPWFIVFTYIGPITIGWRKRVINIFWGETSATKSANELFPREDVTKEGRLIHAWSYEDAKRYIKVILDSVSTDGKA